MIDSDAVEYDFTSGVTTVANLSAGSLAFDTDAGIQTLADMPVATNATGTINSYTSQLDGTPILTIHGVASGSGSIGTTTVGIGTTTPAWKLTVSNSATTTTKAFIGITDELAGANLKTWTLSSQGGSFWIATSSDQYATSSVPALMINTNGNVGIGTSSPSSKLSIEGTCVDTGGGCADIAELYKATEPVFPGDIVAVDVDEALAVKKATASSTLIGVVSTNPAIGINGNGLEFLSGASYQSNPARPAIALSGRVPVKVSTENGPIKIGDRISASSIPGRGMKASSSVETVGIALESFDGSTSTTTEVVNGVTVITGETVVFVNLGQGSVDTGLAAIAAGETNAWSVDQTSGKVNVNFFGDVDLNGNKLLNVAAIVSQNGSWRIDENGRMNLKFLETEHLTVGSAEKPTGITLFDQTTKQPYCITVNSGAVVSTAGDCESLGGVSPIVGSGSTIEPSTPAPADSTSSTTTPTETIGETIGGSTSESPTSETSPAEEPPLESAEADLTGQAAPDTTTATPETEPAPPITSAEPPPAT